jgi:hypothetical protein
LAFLGIENDAEIDTFVADPDSRTGDKLSHLLWRFAAKTTLGFFAEVCRHRISCDSGILIQIYNPTTSGFPPRVMLVAMALGICA